MEGELISNKHANGQSLKQREVWEQISRSKGAKQAENSDALIMDYGMSLLYNLYFYQ